MQDSDFVRDALAWALSSAVSRPPEHPRRDAPLHLVWRPDGEDAGDLLEELLGNGETLLDAPVLSDVSAGIDVASEPVVFAEEARLPDVERTVPVGCAVERTSAASEGGSRGTGRSAAELELERKRWESRKLAQKRRERNRIAARKSNLRRKLARDGLIASLDEARGRVQTLRGRESLLREENLKLRELTSTNFRTEVG